MKSCYIVTIKSYTRMVKLHQLHVHDCERNHPVMITAEDLIQISWESQNTYFAKINLCKELQMKQYARFNINLHVQSHWRNMRSWNFFQIDTSFNMTHLIIIFYYREYIGIVCSQKQFATILCWLLKNWWHIWSYLENLNQPCHDSRNWEHNLVKLLGIYIIYFSCGAEP